ncbi:thyroid receptor-interacting protein 11 [Diorhabda sublineata]|uniref:thyroid receptor-interacting protein 11 n=1 Tax=Diorhabda sublineata TaxID=1163346 RepID=UPI0024E0A395|nr:thyroid receptor-interacting protein 11 [Diorhabda sublineata]
MSWLNFNDSLNNLKGQLSNFASNVLAEEDQGTELKESDYKELQELCVQQELEIKKLRKINAELNNKQIQDVSQPNGSWGWTTTEELPPTESTGSISDLRKQIADLKNEKSDLMAKLEQLDADNQENLINIMQMKEKLQYELNELNNNYISVKEENKILLEKEEKLKNEIQRLEHQTVASGEDYVQKCKEITEVNQKISDELEQLRSELNITKKSNETLQKLLKDTKNTEELAEREKLKKIESENKLLYSELKKANEAISTYEIKSLEDEENCNKLATILETYDKQVSCLKKEIENISKLYEDAQIKLANSEDTCKKLCNDKEEMKTEYNKEILVLKEEIEEHLKIIDETTKEKQNNTKDTIEVLLKELESFKIENENLKKHNEELVVTATGRMDMDLENELEDIQEEHETRLNILREELELLKQQESKNRTDELKFVELEEEKLLLHRELKDVQDELEELKKNHKVSLQELHDKYVNIITENIKKFQECEKPSDFQYYIQEDDPQVVELCKHVESIMKILLDFKCKCAELETRIMELAEEKNSILVEKNREIEKLIQNSDVLSQEILTKTQSLKEFENECNEMAKNNELLISELETLKNNPVLQTISESNEDNMILLESQLENANKRIEDLERIIDDLERNQIRKDSLEDTSDLENAVKQLNITEKEIDDKKKDYEELLNNFDQLQVDNDYLKKEFDRLNEQLEFSNEDNNELKGNLEKLKTDYENTEYQLSEVNINCEALKEEIEEYKTKLKSLLAENTYLKLQNEDNSRKNLDLETKMNVLEEKLAEEDDIKKNYEKQLEVVTEKLKNAKMGETSLKLQYEQKSKELAAQLEERYNLELSLNKINTDLAEFQNNFVELQNTNDKLLLKQKELENDVAEKEETIKRLVTNQTDKQDDNNLKLNLEQTSLENANLQTELSQVKTQLKETTDQCTNLQQQLQEVTNSRNELINMVTMKHQENVTYHNEIQRLNQIVTTEVEKNKKLEEQLKQLQSNDSEIEKLTDQNIFLKEKCEVIAKNLLEEQAKSQQLIAERSERETTLQKKVDRLQAHLIELEEHYTQELLQTEQKNSLLTAKLSEMEEREKNSSTMYTSVNIRANQQVESLQSQLQGVITERDSLRKQISDAEDENSKQAAALANLQFVLEQFRKDKEKDVMQETERIRRHINTEKQIQEELRKEIANLKSQLEERTQGLLAASRISDQLEVSKKTINGLKDEVSQLQTKLTKTEEELSKAVSSTDGKVDKLLIKNLILGYVMSNNNMNRDQAQVLKIISTVLDFNQQDHEKVKFNKPQQGWLASLLAPNPENKMSEESLSKAFIQFLENESKPRVVPSLLDNNTISVPSNASTKSSSSTSSTPRQTPIVLSEIVLPTFTEFAQNRNSSSILKDVLKDNS